MLSRGNNIRRYKLISLLLNQFFNYFISYSSVSSHLHSYYPSTIRLWNSVPPDIQSASCISWQLQGFHWLIHYYPPSPPTDNYCFNLQATPVLNTTPFRLLLLVLTKHTLKSKGRRRRGRSKTERKCAHTFRVQRLMLSPMLKRTGTHQHYIEYMYLLPFLWLFLLTQ